MKYFKEEMKIIEKLQAYFRGTEETAYDWDDRDLEELQEIQSEIMSVIDELDELISTVWNIGDILDELIIDREEEEEDNNGDEP